MQGTGKFMITRFRRFGVMASLLLAIPLLLWASRSDAQSYPDRPIRVIVPIAAGSVTDVIMRATAAELAPRLGQTFVIENKGGASGIPGRKHAPRRRLTATHSASSIKTRCRSIR